MLRATARHPRQGHQLLLRGGVDVKSLLVDQDVAEVAGCAELATMGQVRGSRGMERWQPNVLPMAGSGSRKPFG